MKNYIFNFLLFNVFSFFIPFHVFCMELTQQANPALMRTIEKEYDKKLNKFISDETRTHSEKIKYIENKLDKHAQRLPKERKIALCALKTTRNISDSQWVKCAQLMERCDQIIREKNDWSVFNVDHDKTVPEPFLSMIKQQLKEENINAHSIRVNLINKSPFLVKRPGVSWEFNNEDIVVNITGPGEINIFPIFNSYSLDEKEGLILLFANMLKEQNDINCFIVQRFCKIIIEDDEYKNFGRIDFLKSMIDVAIRSQRNAYLMKKVFMVYKCSFSLKDYNSISSIECYLKAFEWLKRYTSPVNIRNVCTPHNVKKNNHINNSSLLKIAQCRAHSKYKYNKKINFYLARLLLEDGADPDYRSSIEDPTPLMITVYNGDQKYAHLLLEHKADPKKTALWIDLTTKTAFEMETTGWLKTMYYEIQQKKEFKIAQ